MPVVLLTMKQNTWILLLFSVFLFVSSALLISVLSFLGAYSHGSLDYFFHEGHLGTFYPVTLLALSSLSCFLFHLKVTPSIAFVFKKPLNQKNTWFWCGFAFAYLSLDDLFEIHEKIDFKLHHWLDALTNIKSNAFTDKLDDLVVATVLAVAIWFLLRYRKTFSSYPIMLAAYAFSCCLVLLMVALDFLTNGGYILKFLIGKGLYSELKSFLYVIEESLKIFACSFILLGSTVPWLGDSATQDR